MKDPCWPLAHQTPLFPDEAGQFGTVRSKDIHTGVDLYCEINQAVVAMEEGIVVGVLPFTGAHMTKDEDKSPWWNDTWVILVEGRSGVIAYGEINPFVTVGDTVQSSQHIGFVIPVLRTFKGRPMVMLHLERMSTGSRDTVWWRPGETQPPGLLDPTPLLRKASGGNASFFDLDLYDGQRFRDPSARVDIKYAFGKRLRQT